jgi:hypothetical protein
MSTQQPYALGLAERIDRPQIFVSPEMRSAAAAELRRLHSVNAELLEALETIRDLWEYEAGCGDLASRLYDARSISIAAIAKAQGELK